MAEEEWALTTTDNPFSPFENFREWHVFDEMLGHNTNNLLALVVVTSDELSPAQQTQDIRDGMLEIVKHNVSGVHTIVKRTK